MSVYSNLLGLFRSESPLFIDGFGLSGTTDNQYCYIGFFHNPSYAAIYFSTEMNYSNYYEPKKLDNSGKVISERNTFEFTLITPKNKEPLMCGGTLGRNKLSANIRLNNKIVHRKIIFNKITVEEVRHWRNPEKYKLPKLVDDHAVELNQTSNEKFTHLKKFKHQKQSKDTKEIDGRSISKQDFTKYLIAISLFTLVTYLAFRTETFNIGSILRAISNLL